jgi:hypothetical protein
VKGIVVLKVNKAGKINDNSASVRMLEVAANRHHIAY